MLNKKLIRDLWANRGSNLAIIVVISIGIMCYIGCSLILDATQTSMNRFYDTGRFPDAYIEVLGMPYSSLKNVQSAEGVEDAEGRIITDVRVEDGFGASSEETKYIRLISQTERIGKYVLMEGNSPAAKQNQIVVDNKFAEANNIQIGDKIPIIAAGKKSSLEVVGIGRSPEYVYALKNSATLFPDPVTFAIAFMHTEDIQQITGKTQYNQIIYHIQSGFDQKKVEQGLDAQLKKYGIIRAYPMKDQRSHMMLSQEIDQLKAAILVMPVMFLSIASMILYIMVGRIVEKQRGQIGLLKAFGLSDAKIFLHYLQYSSIVGFLGGLLGILWGYLLAGPIIEMYKNFFNMPFVSPSTPFSYWVVSLLLATFFGGLASLRASYKAALLPPSEAMRSKAPDAVRSNFVEKSPLVLKMFTTAGRMSLRNIFRNPARSIFVLIGITVTFAFSVVPWGFLKMTDTILFENYNEVERYQIKIHLAKIMDSKKLESELTTQSYIQLVEGLLEVPATLQHKHIKEEIVVVGIEENSRLYTIKKDGNILSPAPRSIILSERLAAKLGATKGDTIDVKCALFKYKDESERFFVSDIIEQNVGLSAYVNREHLSKLIGSGDLANSILLQANDGSSAILKEKYQDSAVIEGINDVNDMIQMLQNIVNNYLSMMKLMAGISVLMGFAIIYNSYSIILSEREKEFASLLVLGMTEKEVVSIVNLEQWLICSIGIPLGVPLTYIMFDTVGKASSNDMFTLNLKPDGQSMLIGLGFTLFSILIAQLFASYKISHIKISDALKADE